MKTPSISLAAASALLLAACVSVPTGPSLMALPGTGKSFEQFRSDDVQCRQYAQGLMGGASAEQAAIDAGLRSAAVGTVVGAIAGAAIGGHDSAGVGAGTGLLVGSMAGASAAQHSAYATPRNYDNAYIQCMYAKGQRVPVPATMLPGRIQAPNYGPPADFYPPPPPPAYGPASR